MLMTSLIACRYECHLMLSGRARLVGVDGSLSAASLVRSSGTGDLCCGMEVAAVAEQQALSAQHGAPPFLWSHAAMMARVPASAAPPRLLLYHVDRCEEGGACRAPQRARLRTLIRRCGEGEQASLSGTAASAALVPAPAVAAPAPAERVAIVTMVAEGGGWVDGARTLACSVQQAAALPGAPPMALVALCLNVTAAEVEAAGWQCIRPTLIDNPYATRRRTAARPRSRRHPWPWDYTLKIAPFALVEYERVVVLDADMLLVRPRLAARQPAHARSKA